MSDTIRQQLFRQATPTSNYRSTVGVVVVVVVVLTLLTRIIKSVVIGQRLQSHSGVEEYPRKKTQTKPKVLHAYYIIAGTIHTSTRKVWKKKSGVSLRCARSILLHSSHYSRLKITTTPLACHPEKNPTYILHVVPITTHTHVRRRSIGKKKKEKKRQKKEKGYYILVQDRPVTSRSRRSLLLSVVGNIYGC